MTLIIAGATGYGVWPSNTLGGARRCLEAPVDGIEIDVQMTSDGAVVAHHDYRLSRRQTRLNGEWLTGSGPILKDTTLAELKRYDVGRARPGTDVDPRYPHRQHWDGEAIPTLDELFEALKAAPGPRRLFYIEIKTDPTDPDLAPDAVFFTRTVVDQIEAHDYVAHSKIIAFDWQVLRMTAERNPAIATAHLTIPRDLSGGAMPAVGVDSPWSDGFDAHRHGGSDLAAIKAHGGMEWSPYYTDVTSERVEEARALGLKVGPWGLGAGEDIARMRRLGVWSATVSGPDWE
ncbi:MAG TPA: glycerophosphodiester phosphodiesterase family protein [Caulobacteraceae bacterium]